MSPLRPFPLGQHIPGTSYVHRLDPRGKLLFVMMYVIFVFVADRPEGYALLAVLFTLGLVWSKLSLVYLLQALRPVWIILILTALIHIFFTRGGEIIWEWGWLAIHERGMHQAVAIPVRLALMILMASLVSLTTSPMQLTQALESLFSPLRIFRIPVHEFALMMAVALRFIPTLTLEAEKLMNAQMARGADLESRNVWKRGKALVPVLIPLFIRVFRRAEELTEAMEARGYRGGEGRTRWRQIRFTLRDIVPFLLLLFIGIAIWRWQW